MATPANSARYAAFISYRHLPRDRRWVLRIMELLETYRTPAALRQQNYPARIGHLFRDEDEIPASSDLSDQIKEALAKSDNLIVICSPETPASKWVRREIELFQELGKGERIFPLLIAGEPGESFPPELLRRRVVDTGKKGKPVVRWEEAEPTAADVRPRPDEKAAKTERRAVLRLAAALLGCRFDDLARRDEERRAQQLRKIAAACIGLVIGIGGGGFYWWDQNIRVKTQYCNNYGERWGEPSCVGPLDEVQQGRRFRAYKLVSKAGHVIELTRVNGSGHPEDEADVLFEVEDWNRSVARFTYEYGSTGTLNAVTQYYKNGSLAGRQYWNFSPDRNAAIMRFEKEIGTAQRQRAWGSALGTVVAFGEEDTNRSNIGQHRLKFDPQGRIVKRLFEPPGGGVTTGDATGAHGRTYTYGELDLALDIRNLDAVGQALVEWNGVAVMLRNYDTLGRLTQVSWLDEKLRPIPNSEGVSQFLFSRNEDGNIIDWRALDGTGAPALFRAWGVARRVQTYDARGNLAFESYFGIDDKLALRMDIGIAQVEWTNDERGNPTSEAYFDTDGRPVLLKNIGYAKIVRTYDETGNIVEMQCFGVDGRPILGQDLGVARIKHDYDEFGRIIERNYFGVDDKPILNKNDGVARFTWTYDERGNLISESRYGVDAAPILDSFGVARTESKYDERGNAVEIAFFGVDGAPVLHKKEGWARRTSVYDERGNLISNSIYGVDNKPILHLEDGATRIEFKYDQRGNRLETAFFGIDGLPILNKKDGVARYKWTYDSRGNKINETHYGVDGNLILDSYEGAARLEWKYDERGNKIQSDFFGVDGKPILSLGAARKTRKYDNRGNLVQLSYFGTDGKPSLSSLWRAASIEYARDARGNIVEETYLGVDGSLTENALGFARSRQKRDQRDQLIKVEYFDRGGRPVLRSNRVLDDEEIKRPFGDMTEHVVAGGLDKEEIARISNGGYATMEQSFDARGNVIKRAFFGVRGEPVAGIDGFAVEEVEYDAADRPVLFKPSFAGAAAPVHVWTELTYDPRGDMIRADYVSPQGQLIDGKQGFASVLFERSPDGAITRTEFRTAAGQQVAGK